MNVLVTGANGFLGRHVVANLLARGHRVRALVRPATRIEDLAWSPAVNVVRADLRSAQDLEAMFEGVDALVHLAASVSGGEDAQFAATVVGTERLLGAMARTACRRIVLASSFSVYDWSSARGTLDERTPTEPVHDLYARDGYTIAKSWQERVTRRFAVQNGWDLTVLRPGFIWGRDHGYNAAMGQKAGRLQVVIGPLTRLPLTHVENCADLFALAVEDPRASGETLNVVDSDGPRIWSFLREHLHGTGERRICIPIPYHLAHWTIRLAFATVFGQNLKLPNLLIPCRFESRLKPLQFTNRRAREVLGWQPPLDFRECLSRTFGPAPVPVQRVEITTPAGSNAHPAAQA
jgi:UDP-glucose 4-epimerase